MLKRMKTLIYSLNLKCKTVLGGGNDKISNVQIAYREASMCFMLGMYILDKLRSVYKTYLLLEFDVISFITLYADAVWLMACVCTWIYLVSVPYRQSVFAACRYTRKTWVVLSVFAGSMELYTRNAQLALCRRDKSAALADIAARRPWKSYFHGVLEYTSFIPQPTPKYLCKDVILEYIMFTPWLITAWLVTLNVLTFYEMFPGKTTLKWFRDLSRQFPPRAFLTYVLAVAAFISIYACSVVFDPISYKVDRPRFMDMIFADDRCWKLIIAVVCILVLTDGLFDEIKDKDSSGGAVDSTPESHNNIKNISTGYQSEIVRSSVVIFQIYEIPKWQ